MTEKENQIKELLTDEDIEAWHNGEMTEHVEELMAQFEIVELQIWGSRHSDEPLSVVAKS